MLSVIVSVCLSVSLSLCVCGVYRLHMLMESHEILSIIMASLIHDYDHPGYNNQFIIASQDPLAYVSHPLVFAGTEKMDVVILSLMCL